MNTNPNFLRLLTLQSLFTYCVAERPGQDFGEFQLQVSLLDNYKEVAWLITRYEVARKIEES